MGKIKINGNQLMVKEGIFKKITLSMDSLRLVYLFLPESVKSWFVVSSTSGIESYDLDSVSNDNIESMTRKFDDMIRQESYFKLAGIKLCLADYNNRGTIVPFKYFKSCKVDIFSHLLRYRRERVTRREEWLKTNPEVELRGVMGQRATVDAKGFRRGKKSIGWKDVGEIQLDTNNLNTHLLIVPKGVGSGFFSMKKYKYFLTVQQSKKVLYVAECNFWRSLLEEQPEKVDKKEELQWN